MASYAVTTAKHATLASSVVDIVTVSRSYGQVRIVNRSSGGGAAAIFVRLDGVDPAVTADNTFAVSPGQEKLLLPPATESIEVRVISSGAAPYSVEGA
jgi:hypothetical protein